MTTETTARVVTVRIITDRTVIIVDRTIVVRAAIIVTTEMVTVIIVRAAMVRAAVRADRTQTEEAWAMADLREADLTDRVVRVWKAARVIAGITQR